MVAYLGYPFSTGLAAVDALPGDAITTPESDAAIYRERVLRLPHFPFCMQPHASAPPVAPLPAIRNGHLTFGCFNNLSSAAPPLNCGRSCCMRYPTRAWYCAPLA